MINYLEIKEKGIIPEEEIKKKISKEDLKRIFIVYNNF